MTRAQKAAHRRATVERLWAEGVTCREIGRRMGWKTNHPSVSISVLRTQHGYNLPHRRTAEQVARIAAATAAASARAAA